MIALWTVGKIRESNKKIMLVQRDLIECEDLLRTASEGH